MPGREPKSTHRSGSAAAPDSDNPLGFGQDLATQFVVWSEDEKPATFTVDPNSKGDGSSVLVVAGQVSAPVEERPNSFLRQLVFGLLISRVPPQFYEHALRKPRGYGGTMFGASGVDLMKAQSDLMAFKINMGLSRWVFRAGQFADVTTGMMGGLAATPVTGGSRVSVPALSLASLRRSLRNRLVSIRRPPLPFSSQAKIARALRDPKIVKIAKRNPKFQESVNYGAMGEGRFEVATGIQKREVTFKSHTGTTKSMKRKTDFYEPELGIIGQIKEKFEGKEFSSNQTNQIIDTVLEAERLSKESNQQWTAILFLSEHTDLPEDLVKLQSQNRLVVFKH